MLLLFTKQTNLAKASHVARSTWWLSLVKKGNSERSRHTAGYLRMLFSLHIYITSGMEIRGSTLKEKIKALTFSLL